MRKLLALAILAGMPACGSGGASPTPVAAVTTTTATTTTTSTTTTTTVPPTSRRENFSGALSAGAATCSSPGSIHDDKPCRSYTFAVTIEGAFSADCNWSPRDTDIDLELWRGNRRLIFTLDVANPERMSSTVTPGEYEVRVIYYQGTATTFYNITIVHPI